MPDVIQLSCASCGAKLKITDDIERFACSNCGNEFLVRRGDGIVSLQPVVQGLSEILVENKRISSELALARLRPELAELQAELKVIRSDAEKEQQVLDSQVRAKQDKVNWAVAIAVVGAIALANRSTIGALVLVGSLIFLLFAYSSLRQQKKQRKAVLASYDAGITECQAEIAAKQREVDAVVTTLAPKPNGR